MTVNSQINRAGPFSSNGVTVSFPFTNMRILDRTHLAVIVEDLDGTQTTATIDVDYDVTGVGDPTGGDVIFNVAPAGDKKIVILRDVPATQEADYVNADDFPAETHERALDKLTMLVQQASERISRAIVQSATSAIVDLKLPTPIAGRALKWNPSENGFVNSSSDPDDASAAALLAQKWASEAEDVQVTSGLFSAYHYMRKALGHAFAAGTDRGLAEDARDAAIAAKDNAVAVVDAALLGSVPVGALVWQTVDEVSEGIFWRMAPE